MISTKKILAVIAVCLAYSGTILAQSMSDSQIIKFVTEEQSKGSTQAQIVTKLMQKGVTIDQIRRLKEKYEKQNGKSGMGIVDVTGKEKTNGRLRTNNSKLKEEQAVRAQNYQLKEDEEIRKKRFVTRKDQETEDQYMMRKELSTFMPDSAEIYEQEYLDRLAEKKDRSKQVFGRDIFNNKELSFEPNMNIATPQDYRLGAGDVVFVDVWGASQENFESTVTPDGTIQIEGFGPVEVGGLTVAQANKKLKSTLGARYSSSKIRLTVGQTKTIMVNVMGEVEFPGSYTLSAFATVFHALYMAGGTNDIGTLRNIKVYRKNKLVSTVDIYDYILNGKLKGNIKLADNDVIVVSPYDCLVKITGKVKRPMFYEMKNSESVKTLIDYAGGFKGDAYKKAIKLFRKSGAAYSAYHVEEFDMSSFKLNDEDSVSVDSVLARYANMAEVRGAVFRPGMYQLDGTLNSVRTLIERAEGPTEDAIQTRAIIHRLKADRTLEVISVDLKAIMEGTAADIPLKSEDVLYVASRKELTAAQTITIHGEVMYPGVYQYAEKETLEDFVLQAGGLTESASLVKVDVARRIVINNATTSTDTLSHVFTFTLSEDYKIDGDSTFTLMPFDEVYVRKSPGYQEQQNITIEGEVLFSGTYTLSKKDERLSDLIKRAGGVTNMAYVKGARLLRKVTEMERKRMEEVAKMQREQKEQVLIAQALKSGRSTADLKMSADNYKYEIPETYPVGIELEKALAKPGSDADLVLREGDRLIVPLYNGTVKINGEVMYPNTVGFQNGKKVKYYINQAGGYSNQAKKNQTYIIYMNGDVAKVNGSTKVQPGCEIVVPAKTMNKMTTTETIALASGTASIATMIATLVNLLK